MHFCRISVTCTFAVFSGVTLFYPDAQLVRNFVSSLQKLNFIHFKYSITLIMVFGMYLQIFNEYYFIEVKIF